MKKLYVLASISLLVYLTIQFPYLMVNPGELSKGHQQLKNECSACHTPLKGAENSKCIACHQLSEIGKDSSKKDSRPLFHEQLLNQNCHSCHVEHQGLLPKNSLKEFKHELLSENIINSCISCHVKPVNNLHNQLTNNCSSCHETTSWKNTKPFNHSVLLNKGNCASCHQAPKDDFHGMVKQNCDKCHSTTKWEPANFDHSSYFVLDQNHQTKCNTCHTQSNYKFVSCYGCHEHTKSNIMAEHNEEGIYNIDNCVSCHKSGNKEGMENEHGDDD